MNRLALLAVALSGSALGACATPALDPRATLPTAADLHRIEVSRGIERLSLDVRPGEPLSAHARAMIGDFAALHAREGRSVIVIAAPTGAEPAADLVRAELESRGVADARIEPAASAAAGVSLRFERLIAIGPDCHGFGAQNMRDDAHQPWRGFGCAQQANLAAMIADPADLVSPAAATQADAARRATILQRYRAGQSTHAERSRDERASVSNRE